MSLGAPGARKNTAFTGVVSGRRRHAGVSGRWPCAVRCSRDFLRGRMAGARDIASRIGFLGARPGPAGPSRGVDVVGRGQGGRAGSDDFSATMFAPKRPWARSHSRDHGPRAVRPSENPSRVLVERARLAVLESVVALRHRFSWVREARQRRGGVDRRFRSAREPSRRLCPGTGKSGRNGVAQGMTGRRGTGRHRAVARSRGQRTVAHRTRGRPRVRHEHRDGRRATRRLGPFLDEGRSSLRTFEMAGPCGDDG